MRWVELRHNLIETYSRQFVLKQWNLKPVRGGWQNAVGYGAIFTDDDIEYMMQHGVVPPSPVQKSEEPEWMKKMTTAQIIDMIAGKKKVKGKQDGNKQ